MDNILKKFTTPNTQGSYFLSFEGIEGAGKSTQLQVVKRHLESKGLSVTVVREPGGTPFGEALRAAILQSDKKIHPLSEAYLFASSRAQLLQDVILPKLGEPKSVVICDRYIDSSLAYQGVARNLGIETILNFHSYSPLNILPHKTFYIKIDLETSLERQRIRNQKKDYFESQGVAFYKQLIYGYDKAAELFPSRISVIDGNQSVDKISTDILEIVEGLLDA